MDDRLTTDLAAWVTQAGLKGYAETILLSGFCERIVAAGIPLAKALLIVDTLHPIHEGRVFRWQLGSHESTIQEYGRTTEGAAAEAWRRSPFYHLWQSGEPFLQRRLTPETTTDFPILEEMRKAGLTDYLAVNTRFAADGAIGEMDGILSSWATDAPDGFGERASAELRRLVPFLALAVKS